MDEGRLIAALIGLTVGATGSWLSWRYRIRLRDEITAIRRLLEELVRRDRTR